MAKYKNSTVDRLKALKIKESDFFFFKTIYVHESISHVSLLSDQFCIYMLKLRFLIERKQNYRRDPLPPPLVIKVSRRFLSQCCHCQSQTFFFLLIFNIKKSLLLKHYKSSLHFQLPVVTLMLRRVWTPSLALFEIASNCKKKTIELNQTP